MSHVKSIFYIKDLENLSGIKAHTIRIWERRYNLLSPSRSDINTRVYNTEDLQKLLNIVLLMRYGFKISRLAELPSSEIEALVEEVRSDKFDKNHVLHQFKVAMMTFDQRLFMDTYHHLLKQRSFRQVFFDYFIPLLNEIGVLWQTKTITPANEHFISNLIRLKIQANTDAIDTSGIEENSRVYVLFLPVGEIHELGLLYLNFELISNGYRTIYLGENSPIESLEQIKHLFKPITFVTYATVAPSKSELYQYIQNLEAMVANDNCDIWVLGHAVHQEPQPANPQLRFFGALRDVLSEI